MVVGDVVVVVSLGLTAAGVLLAVVMFAWQVRARRDDRDRADEHATETAADAERQAAEALLHWLAGRRVLWNPMWKEIPEEVVESVQMVRERVEADFVCLRSSAARQAMKTIRGACLDLLDEPREIFLSFSSPAAEETLAKFRDRVRPAVEDVATTYGLEPPKWPNFFGGFEDEGKAIYVPPPKIERDA